MSSGKITVLWSGPSGADVSITPGAFTVAGSPASFPVTITGATKFETSNEGEYTVSVSYRGQEVANHTLWLSSGSAYVFNAELDDAELLDAIDASAVSGLTAANNLSDVASASTTRTNLGLGNVSNTSDANKPVSTAQQAALDLTKRGKDPRDINAALDLTGVADAGTAIRAALVFGDVVLPKGTFKITGDLTITADQSTLRGMGDGTNLAFVDGGIVFDGSTTVTSECLLKDVRVSRTGTAGPAIRLKGGGSAKGAVRTNLINVRVSASTGQALLIDGSYVATCTGCYFTGSTVGIEVAADSVAGTVFGNLITVIGGETQGNAVGVKIDGGVGINFYGHGIEGNTTSGVELVRNTRAIGFYGCYFEANVGWDIKVGTSSGACIATVINGCFFTDGVGNKTNGIILVRSFATVIEGNTFGSGYGAEPVSVEEAVAGNVTGVARNNVASNTDGTGIVAYGTSTLFNRTKIGYETSIGVKGVLRTSAVLDFGSIGAAASATLTMTVTGAAVGDDCTIHTNGTPATGILFTAWVSATDTVTVRATNITAAPVDPAAATMRTIVWKF